MPLALDYSFVDTDREVLVTLPLKVAPGAVHVDVTRCSLKVNQTPYLLQLDLHGDVEWEAAATTVDAATRQVRVVLKKVVKGRWPAIRFSGPADAAAARRAAAEEEAAKRSAELSAARQSTKAKLERAAVTAQLVVDEDARRTMDRAKAEMHTAAEAEVFATFQALAKGEAAPSATAPPTPAAVAVAASVTASASTTTSAAATTTASTSRSRPSSSPAPAATAASAQPKRSVRFADDSDDATETSVPAPASSLAAPAAGGTAASDRASRAAAGVAASAAAPSKGATGNIDTGREIFDDARADAAVGTAVAVPPPRRELPPPRTRLVAAAAAPSAPPASAGSGAATADGGSAGNSSSSSSSVSVPLTFTPRVFPTPARESQAAQEDEWLRRNKAYLDRKRTDASGSISASAGEVVAARVRAREMYASGDFRGAHFAYGAVVEGMTATGGGGGGGAATAATTAGTVASHLTDEEAAAVATARTGSLAARMRCGMFEGMGVTPPPTTATGAGPDASAVRAGAIVRAVADWHTRNFSSAEAALAGAISGGTGAATPPPSDGAAAACAALGTALLDILAAERATSAMKGVADAAARSGDRTAALAWYTVAHGVTPSHLPTLSNLGAVAFTAQHHDASLEISSHSRRVVSVPGGGVPPVTESAWLPAHGTATATGTGVRDWDAATAAAQDAKFATRMAAAQRAMAAAVSS